MGWSVLPGTTRWEERYRTGSIPWNIGKPDVNLIEIVTKRPILSCKALDIGCGTGDDAVWLAEQGFEVTGTDVSRTGNKGVRATHLTKGLGGFGVGPR